ncbi:MAG: hypothetical protein IH593_13955, partial [Bacteroidales bacterium]|nr:hypothetical protein [Bacteroidales bacterium]
MKKTFILFVIALTFQGCNPPPEFAEINGLTQGTTYHIVFETSPDRDLSEIRLQIEKILTEVDNSLSIYN